MPIDLPYHVWLVIGLFVGLFLGNRKFRRNIGELFSKIMRGKQENDDNRKRTSRRRHDDEEDYPEFEDGDKIVIRRGRHTTIREIHFED